MKKKVSKKKRAPDSWAATSDSSSNTISVTIDPEKFEAQLDSQTFGDKTPFREYISKDNVRKQSAAEDVKDARITELMDELATARDTSGRLAAAARAEELEARHGNEVTLRERLLDIIKLLASKQ